MTNKGLVVVPQPTSGSCLCPLLLLCLFSFLCCVMILNRTHLRIELYKLVGCVLDNIMSVALSTYHKLGARDIYIPHA